MGIGAKVHAAAGGVALLLALGAATQPSVLARASGGLWELSAASPGSGPSRQCIANPAVLAQIEHRRSKCTRTVIRETPTSAEVDYSCPDGSFGRTTITMITPRSYRVATQGISKGAPFNYVVQARRVGNCPAG